MLTKQSVAKSSTSAHKASILLIASIICKSVEEKASKERSKRLGTITRTRARTEMERMVSIKSRCRAHMPRCSRTREWIVTITSRSMSWLRKMVRQEHPFRLSLESSQKRASRILRIHHAESNQSRAVDKTLNEIVNGSRSLSQLLNSQATQSRLF